MATSAARKPLPALAFLLALSLLTALVWWRVLHRADAASPKSSGQATCSAAVPTTTVPSPQAVTLTVLNSTDRTGLAASTGAGLTALGFKVTATANDTTSRAPVTGVAEVRFGPLGKPAATLVSYYVVGATLVPDSRADAGVDLALGAKFTVLATAAVVAKALAAAHLTQLPPPVATSTTPAPPAGSTAAATPAATSSAAPTTTKSC